MAFYEAYFDIGRLDILSYKDTVVQRLDARIKAVVTLFFIVAVISFPKYEVFGLAPFFLYPVVLMALADVPFMFILKKVAFVSPFAVFVGIFNPILDRDTVFVLFGMPVSGGWLSFASILVKFALTVSAALVLIATTSFPAVCGALGRMGAPKLFVSQLLFLYRYLFVLMEEAMRMLRARDMRSFGRRGMGPSVAAGIMGALFIRTVERSERIYSAMLSKGFKGEMPVAKRTGITPDDLIFLVVSLTAVAVFRMFPVASWIGGLAGGILR